MPDCLVVWLQVWNGSLRIELPDMKQVKEDFSNINTTYRCLNIRYISLVAFLLLLLYRYSAFKGLPFKCHPGFMHPQVTQCRGAFNFPRLHKHPLPLLIFPNALGHPVSIIRDVLRLRRSMAARFTIDWLFLLPSIQLCFWRITEGYRRVFGCLHPNTLCLRISHQRILAA